MAQSTSSSICKYALSDYDNTMNTTAYGEEFEKQVYNYLKSILIADDVPGASAKRSRIFFKKRYATLTDRTIITDVSIETYISDEKEELGEWSTLIIFECKRYKNTVDIADLDEFESKLRKMGGYGVKGYFVTTSGFTQTTINDASKYHYGLVIFDKNGNWKWEVPRDTRRGKNEEYIPVLTGESVVGISPLVYANGCFSNIMDLLKDNDVPLPFHRTIKVSYLSKETIRDIANRLYIDNSGIDDDIAGCLLSRLYPHFHINFEILPHGVEGRTSIKEHIIVLSSSLISNQDRLRFTLAHELGHLVLHSKILAAYEGLLGDTPYPLSESDLKWMDSQANKFASYILMPHITFRTFALSIFKALNINTGKFIVDKQPFKAHLLQSILYNISSHFKVSKEAVFIRLKEEGLVEDLRNNPKRIGDMLRGF